MDDDDEKQVDPPDDVSPFAIWNWPVVELVICAVFLAMLGWGLFGQLLLVAER